MTSLPHDARRLERALLQRTIGNFQHRAQSQLVDHLKGVQEHALVQAMKLIATQQAMRTLISPAARPSKPGNELQQM